MQEMEKRLLKPKGKEKVNTASKEEIPFKGNTSKSLYSEKSSKVTNRSISPMQTSSGEEETPITKVTKKELKLKHQENEESFQFGNVTLPICFDPLKKFRTAYGSEVTKKQQCLLDNLWHIKTVSQATSFKVQVLNALSFYFSEQKNIVPENKRKFSHYVIFRGTKIGLFNDFNTVRKHIMCPSPIFKGFYSFKEALASARESLGLNFYIEPEKVKSFADVAKENPSELIQSQQTVIRKLEAQLVTKEKENLNIFLEKEKIKNENLSKNKEILDLKNEISRLENKVLNLRNSLKKGEKEFEIPQRSFENFKSRVLDIPLKETLKPIFEKIPDLEQVINQKILEDFPDYLMSLQEEILNIYCAQMEGVTVVQKPRINYTDYSNGQIGILNEYTEMVDHLKVSGLLMLQINLNKTDLPFDKIITYFHNGMIDFIEFSYAEKLDTLLNSFGEKFLLVAGNIASLSYKERAYCKVIASLPEVIKSSYRPARKSIIVTDNIDEGQHLKNLHTVEPYDLEEDKKKVIIFQQSKFMADFHWGVYKLIAEGHYIKIWTTGNWSINLPFSGEGDTVEYNNNFLNDEDPTYVDTDDNQSMDTIPDTHRDF